VTFLAKICTYLVGPPKAMGGISNNAEWLNMCAKGVKVSSVMLTVLQQQFLKVNCQNLLTWGLVCIYISWWASREKVPFYSNDCDGSTSNTRSAECKSSFSYAINFIMMNVKFWWYFFEIESSTLARLQY
jgi:hypothetical protein